MSSDLHGRGIEIGAGNDPFPVPAGCEVAYVDRLTKEQFEEEFSGYLEREPSLNAITPDFLVDCENLNHVPGDSLDFIIASHVIEHTRNPLLVLEQAYKKLSTGGQFVLIVPEMRRTVDRNRELTSLAHLILDYRKPNRQRDMQHYLEVATVAYPQPADNLWLKLRLWMEHNKDIHYHTFTHDSFLAMVEYSRSSISPWSRIWSFDPFESVDSSNEFYFILTR